MNGYLLKKIFDKSVNYFWAASLSQIYRELGTLVQKGYLTSSIEEQEDRLDKRIFSITGEGKQAFQAWLNGSLKRRKIPSWNWKWIKSH